MNYLILNLLQRVFVLLCFLFSVSVYIAQPTLGLLKNSKSSRPGYILFAPLFSKNTYLINKKGEQVHVWRSRYNPAQSVYLLRNGNLLRTGNDSSAYFFGGGGKIELLDWNSKVLWNYSISDSLQRQHHDICPMPNGNILVLVWEKKTRAEAIKAGRDPQKLGLKIWSEKIVELKPVGTNSAQIVWEWKVWDHLVQDTFPQYDNYGKVNLLRGRLNINYGANVSEDWLHFNSLDYNPVLDQVLISNRNLNEIFVIDHSTTTAEAKGNTGGKQKRGGDFLYRWGNTAVYNMGTVSDQRFFKQHHAHWIPQGLPFAGKIMTFNNGTERPAGAFSSVEIIQPPVDAAGTYSYSSEKSFLPVEPEWIYKGRPDTSFYSVNVSSSQVLPDGNVLICEGAGGKFFEIDNKKNIVWMYVNPVRDGAFIKEGEIIDKNQVFRCTYYDPKFHPLKRKRLSK